MMMKLMFLIFFEFSIGIECITHLKKFDNENITTTADISIKELLTRLCDSRSTCKFTQYELFPLWNSQWPNRNCMCDKNCIIHGDCCPDSPFYNKTEQETNYEMYRCSNLSGNLHYYMKQFCPKNYTNTIIRLKCENNTIGEKTDDVKLMKPVTDTRQNITYANEYCALCNGISDFHSWPLKFTCRQKNTGNCTTNRNEITGILENARFDQTTKVFNSFFNGKNYTCSHDFIEPESLQSYIRPCFPEVISSCPEDYNQKIINLCNSFTQFVHTTISSVTKIYRNKYCAECNKISLNLRNCSNIGSILNTKASSLPSSVLFNEIEKKGSFQETDRTDYSNLCITKLDTTKQGFC